MKFKVMLENERRNCLIMLNVKVKKEEISKIFGDEFLIDLILDEKKNFNYLPECVKSFAYPEQIDELTDLIQTRVSKIVCKEYEYEWKMCGYRYGKNFEVFW